MVILRSSRRASGVNAPIINKKRKNNSSSPVVANESSTSIQIKNDPDSQAANLQESTMKMTMNLKMKMKMTMKMAVSLWILIR